MWRKKLVQLSLRIVFVTALSHLLDCTCFFAITLIIHKLFVKPFWDNFQGPVCLHTKCLAQNGSLCHLVDHTSHTVSYPIAGWITATLSRIMMSTKWLLINSPFLAQIFWWGKEKKNHSSNFWTQWTCLWIPSGCLNYSLYCEYKSRKSKSPELSIYLHKCLWIHI